MAPTTPPRIAVVLCTSRQPRCNPQIADFVIQTIKAAYPQPPADTTTTTTTPTYTLHTIDLAERNLPFLDEPEVPSLVTDPTKYVHPHTRAWSAEVSSYSGFIFVTPQYNWGYPAVLKNAIDYLFNEWKGKAAMIVSYGGHGGGKSNAQLRQVLGAIDMLVTKGGAELTFPDKPFMRKALSGKELGLGDEGSKVWKNGDGEKAIVDAFGELLELAGASGMTKTMKSVGMKWGLFKEELWKRYRFSSPKRQEKAVEATRESRAAAAKEEKAETE